MRPCVIRLVIIQSYPQNPAEFFWSLRAVRASVLRTEMLAVQPSSQTYWKSLSHRDLGTSDSRRQRMYVRPLPDQAWFQLAAQGMVSSNVIMVKISGLVSNTIKLRDF